ncbi:hypothetical protein ACFO1B_23975 [Dactylosporangium siamense]|uniref:Uncharacterized protein n=1 Tax=Dactylosporangium siamense TaxID=685454 RepID=A0A919UD32_9ACTN|nr:hypothetical protein [Dactylosporangium siamense]GIG47260.1 hypothetical protein Dsi01nite_053010 [Dactylosporangium siamense]
MSEYGEFQTGAESGEIEQLHTEAGSEQDYQSDFGVYSQDSASAESTDFETGKHVEYEGADGSRYESTDYTSYSHDEAETNSVFAAEGSEQSHTSEYASMDALRAQFESAFAEGTQITDGGHGPAIAGH